MPLLKYTYSAPGGFYCISSQVGQSLEENVCLLMIQMSSR